MSEQDRTEDELVELVNEIATFGKKHDVAFAFYLTSDIAQIYYLR